MKQVPHFIARALPGCAGALTILTLSAFEAARADIVSADNGPVQCGPATPFGVLCANVSFTKTATTPSPNFPA
jgi:hypothetical protein